MLNAWANYPTDQAIESFPLSAVIVMYLLQLICYGILLDVIVTTFLSLYVSVYYIQARQAYLIGNKALAKELSVKGQLHNMHMKAAHGKAQESIYRQRFVVPCLSMRALVCLQMAVQVVCSALPFCSSICLF